MRKFPALLILVSLLLLTGCGGAKTPPATPPAVSSPQPGTLNQATSPVPPVQPAPTAEPAVPGFYPSDTRTGTAAVDGVIAAVVSGKAKTLTDHYQPVTLPCLKREWHGAPLCPADKPAGTPVKAYPYAWCNLDFKTEQSALTSSLETALGSGNHLYAVYKPTRVPGLDKSDAAYAVVFGTGKEYDAAPTIYLDKDGNLLLVRSGCGAPDLAVPAGAELVLAPKVPASEARRREAEAGLSAVVEGEVRQMHTAVRIALQEIDPCVGSTKGCTYDTNNSDFGATAAALTTRCDKVGPDAQMSGYAYNEQLHGPVFRSYKAACETLWKAQDTLGKPANTPAWKELLLSVRQQLDPAVKHMDGSTAK